MSATANEPGWTRVDWRDETPLIGRFIRRTDGKGGVYEVRAQNQTGLILLRSDGRYILAEYERVADEWRIQKPPRRSENT